MKHIPNINGLKCLGIAVITLYQLQLFLRPLVPPSFHPLLLFFDNGQFGENIFLLLSGFLITSLLLHEENEYGTVNITRFYGRRLLGILPAYFFFLTVFLFAQVSGLIKISALTWWSSVTFTRNLVTTDSMPGHSWLLSLVIQFYLLWPVVFKAFPKGRRKLALAMIAVVPLLRMAAYIFPDFWLGTITNLLRLDALFWGCAIALHQAELSLFVKKVRATFRQPLLLPAVVFLFVSGVAFLNQQLRLHLGALLVGFGGEYGTLACACIGFVLLCSVSLTDTRWARFLNHPVMEYIGRLSLSLYLWQQFFSFAEFHLATPPVNLLCSFLLANLSYYFVERLFAKKWLQPVAIKQERHSGQAAT